MNSTGPDKLYIAVRADLPPGLQMAQVAHAAFEFSHSFPDTTHRWLSESNYIVIVAVADEDALRELAQRAVEDGLRCELIEEPDIGNEFTALAIEPGADAARLCATFPLALRERVPI